MSRKCNISSTDFDVKVRCTRLQENPSAAELQGGRPY